MTDRIDWTEGVALEHFVEHPEEASPAAVRALAVRLLELGVSTTGTSERQPGLYVHARPYDVSAARQLVSLGTASTAVHSRTRGWMPMVLCTWTHIPLRGAASDRQELAFVVPPDTIATVVEDLLDAAEAAARDAAAGPVEGDPDR